MLTRVVKKRSFEGWTYATDDEYSLDFEDVPEFADDASISPWAKESVYFMVATGVITGLDDNAFSPRATAARDQAAEAARLTREQALVLGARIVERLTADAGRGANR